MLHDLGGAGVDGPLNGLALDVRHVVVEGLAQVAVVVALVDQELGLQRTRTAGGQIRASASEATQRRSRFTFARQSLVVNISCGSELSVN